MNRRRAFWQLGMMGGGGSTPVTVAISGTVTDGITPVAGVTITFGSYSAITASDGTYTIENIPVDIDGLLVPSKTAYVFSPESNALTTSAILGNITNQDFIPFVVILYDEFITADVAPITSPRTCEPGPGMLAITDAGNMMAISGGKLVFSGTTVGHSGLIANDSISRAAGRAASFYIDTLISDSYFRWSWAVAVANEAYYFQEGSPTTMGASGGKTFSISKPLLLSIVQRTTGAFFLHNSKIVWVANLNNNAYKPEVWVGGGQTPNMSMPYMSVIDLVGMNADDKVYTYFDATPTTDDVATHVPNAILEITWTPVANETFTFMFRRADDDNCLIIKCVQASNTITAYKRVAGVETGLPVGGPGDTQSQTWNVGTAYRIVIILDGVSITSYVNGTLKTSTNSTNFSTGTGVKISGFTTGANLYCWKTDMTVNLPPLLKPVINYRYYLVIGDSKSVNNVWENAFETLVSSSAASWTEAGTYAGVGWSVHVAKAGIDAWLAGINATPAPEFLCLNLGTNDVNGDAPNDVFYGDANEDGSEWTAKLAYILDAIHAKWPSCACYVMRPWKPDYDGSFQTKLNLIGDTLIPNTISGRAWAHLGPDERIFLENGDNGTTYISADRLHPNMPGYTLTAAQWKTVLGL